MSGMGSDFPTYEPLRQALEQHAKDVYGDQYVVADFVMLAYVVPMDHENESSEYIMVTSTQTSHIIEGLVGQVKLFRTDPHNDDDDD